MAFIVRIVKALATPILVLAGYIFQYLDLKMIVGVYLLFCLFHFLTSKTKLHYTKNEKNNKILSSCQTLQSKFTPHFLLPTAALQLLCFSFIQGPPEEFEIIREKVNEYGMNLDWISFSTKKSKKDKIEDLSENSEKPILFILPGLTGGKSDNYVQNIAYEALKNNYIPVVYQNRYLSDSLKLTEDKYIDLFEDLDHAIDSVEKKYPKNKIYAVGFSYGANKLVNYLGTINLIRRRIHGGVSVGNPYDMLTCQRDLSETIFEHFILQLLKKNLNTNIKGFSQPHSLINVEVEKAQECKTVKEYDEFITRRVFGYKSPDDYYRGISCVHHIDKIDVPLLLISALDDNITSAKAIPYDETALNHNVFLLVADKGGHLCWIDNQSFFRLKQWVNKPVIEFINSIKQ